MHACKQKVTTIYADISHVSKHYYYYNHRKLEYVFHAIMEMNRKRRGFKGMLPTPLQKSPKQSLLQVSSKYESTPSSSTTPMSYLAEPAGYYITPGTKQIKVVGERGLHGGSAGQYGGFGAEDIDKKAAAYISYVQERFKREQVDWEKKKTY